MKRLLGYLKPHKWTMLAATVLVLFIIVVELYRPIIIGDAIDNYINGYYQPYVESDAGTSVYDGAKLERCYGDLSDEALASPEPKYYQILLYEDEYYMAEGLTAAETVALRDAEAPLVKEFIDTHTDGTPLEKQQLRQLRKSDFSGILSAAALYLTVLLAGFVLNWADTWILQKMGQRIIFDMRAEVYSHIQSLSLNFFNNTPVGKLVTRVSNDTESINELFTTILVRL